MWGSRAIVFGAAIATATLGAGCEALPSGMMESGSLACDGTERALCGAVSELAIEQMNLSATGPITNVTLTRFDCVRGARSMFNSELATASDCWEVSVTGERSHGRGVVARMPDGILRPYWP